MANFRVTTRKNLDNTTSHTAWVTQKASRFNKVFRGGFRKNLTFQTRLQAEIWGQELTAALESGEDVTPYLSANKPVSFVLRKILESDSNSKSLSQQQANALERLADYEVFVKKSSCMLTPYDIKQVVSQMTSDGCSPSTCKWYLDNLSSALESAETACGIKATNKAIVAARPSLKKLKLIGDSTARVRIVTYDEYDSILNHCVGLRSNERIKTPYAEIFRFATSLGLREGEHEKLDWKDVDLDKMRGGRNATIVIHNHKDNNTAEGTTTTIPLTIEAYNVLMQLGPKTKGRIFPYNFDSVARMFRKFFAKLDIVDLQFRDFRRTAITELALSGLSLQEVAVISRHRDLKVLEKHYIQIDAYKVAKKLQRLPNAGLMTNW